MRLRYRLLKDTPELKAGAIVQEECDDGTQDFENITHEHAVMQSSVRYDRKVVMEQPEWFEKVEVLHMPSTLVEKFTTFLKSL